MRRTYRRSQALTGISPTTSVPPSVLQSLPCSSTISSSKPTRVTSAQRPRAADQRRDVAPRRHGQRGAVPWRRFLWNGPMSRPTIRVWGRCVGRPGRARNRGARHPAPLGVTLYPRSLRGGRIKRSPIPRAILMGRRFASGNPSTTSPSACLFKSSVQRTPPHTPRRCDDSCGISPPTRRHPEVPLRGPHLGISHAVHLEGTDREAAALGARARARIGNVASRRWKLSERQRRRPAGLPDHNILVLTIVNGHNHDISMEQRAATRRGVERRRTQSLIGVVGASLWVVAGDHNAAAADTQTAHICPTGRARIQPRAQADNAWRNVFSNVLEVASSDVTRMTTQVHEDCEYETIGITTDYLYISTPRLLVPQYNFTIRNTRQTQSTASLSDHIAQRLTMTLKPPARRSARQVPQWVAAHPIFRGNVATIDAILEVDADARFAPASPAQDATPSLLHSTWPVRSRVCHKK